MALTNGKRAKFSRFKAVVERARRLLYSGPAGTNGIRALSRSLGVAVDAGGTLVEKAIFVQALNSNGVSLSDDDVDAIMHVLDRNGEGKLDPVDFIAALRLELTPVKHTWIIRVWYIFNQNRDGTIQIDELVGTFHPSGHPDVVKGERSEQEVREEFEANFNSTTNPDGVITRQEFEEYYSCVAGLCPDDKSFVELMRGVWPAAVGASGEQSASFTMQQDECNKTFKATQSAAQKLAVNMVRQSAADLNELILTVHRPSVMVAPLSVRHLSLFLREVDIEKRYFLPKDVFLGAMWKKRLYFTNAEYLLSVLDTRGDGSVDYLLYLQLLLPQISPARIMMIERLWELFPKDACGTIDIMEIHSRFHAKDGEEKNNFLSAWDVRSAINRRITLEELIEWYTPTSATIQLDKDFDIMLKRQWGIE
ncbi:EF-hand domain [Trypanosoma melophagium]|uniref:EF-hand domain n=1 Tax=Trypanosoma melophagium TaxID=715481 RepID=UPI00351AADBC|nr:EF-hand domain [Trypanosoma melophagium]